MTALAGTKVREFEVVAVTARNETDRQSPVNGGVVPLWRNRHHQLKFGGFPALRHLPV